MSFRFQNNSFELFKQLRDTVQRFVYNYHFSIRVNSLGKLRQQDGQSQKTS